MEQILPLTEIQATQVNELHYANAGRSPVCDILRNRRVPAMQLS